MEEYEQGTEDGMLYVVRHCECGYKSKAWYDLDEIIPENVSWLNEKGDAV